MANLNNGVFDGVRRIGASVRDLAIGGGLPGAPLGYRLRGATQSGPPPAGTWKTGDLVPDRTGAIRICTVGGTGPAATWVTVGGLSGAGDASLVVTGGTIEAATLDVIASLHPPAASVPMGSQKLTSLLAGTASTDGANTGQVAAVLANSPASQMGYAAWSGDPNITGLNATAAVLGNAGYMAAGNLASSMLFLPTAQTLNGYLTFYWVQPTGGSPLHGYIGVYTSAGVQVAAYTTDLTTVATGLQRVSLGITSWAAGYYEVVAVVGTQGSTAGGCAPFTGAPPGLSGGALLSKGRLSAPWRTAYSAAVASSLPASIGNFSSWTPGTYTMFAALD